MARFVTWSRVSARFALIALTSAALALGSAAAQAQTKLRVGIGAAAEDPFWLLLVKPELGSNHGKGYTTEYTRFPGADKRFQAFEAGALDIATSSANAALFAAGEGIEFKIIASIARESPRGFYTKFAVKNDSPIKSIKDVVGKTIGINGFSGSGHLWVRAALERAGLTEKQVTLVPLPFPAQAEALKAGKIDVGMFPQPFAEMIQRDGGYRTVFTSKDGAPFEEELILLIAKNDFLQKNRPAVEAMLADVVKVLDYYGKNQREAKTALIDAKLVRLSPEIYIGMQEYYRDPGAKVDVQALERMQELQVKAGFQKNAADLKKYIDLSYLPK